MFWSDFQCTFSEPAENSMFECTRFLSTRTVSHQEIRRTKNLNPRRLIRAIWTALRNFSPFLPVPVGSARLQTGSVRFRTVASNCGSALFRTESGVSSWKVPSDFRLLFLDSDISAGFRILPYDFIFFHSI